MRKFLVVFGVLVLIIIVLCGCKNSSIENLKEVKVQEESKSTIGNTNVTNESGLLLGFSCSKEEEINHDEDPKSNLENYKTIWIAPTESSTKYLEKDGLIVAPGSDGFYEYRNVQSAKKKEYQSGEYDFYDIELNKMISHKVGEKFLQPEIDLSQNYLVDYSESNNLLFVGNNSSIIYTQRIYTSGAGGYQYVPSIRVFKDGNIAKTWMEKGV